MQYNSTKPPIPLAALYIEPAPISLDYPYAVMPGTDPVKVKAAEGLFRVLTTNDFKNRLGAQHLRAADGTWGAGFEAPTGAPSPAGTPQVTASPNAGGTAAGGFDPAAVEAVLATWTAVTLPARMLAVIDVSGTMRGAVPVRGRRVPDGHHQGGRDPGPRPVRRRLGGRALDLLDQPGRRPGLQGAGADRPAVRVRATSSMGALQNVQPKRGGDTGLYDTILAGYKNVQDGWQAGRINSMVMLTDGIGNDDPDGGIDLPALLDQLGKIKDDKRPVQVIIIGLGDAMNRGPLDQIVRVTGGGVFVAEDPAKIGEIFLRAISLRPSQPR